MDDFKTYLTWNYLNPNVVLWKQASYDSVQDFSMAGNLELFHLHISKLKAERVFKNVGYSMSLGVVHIWSTSFHLLVQLCLNTCNCSTASLYWSLERNQNKYLDHCLLYLALPDWKLDLLVLLERLTAKAVCISTLLVQELDYESTRQLTFFNH